MAAQVVEHPERGAVARPLRAELYVRKEDVPERAEWYRWEFKTKTVGVNQRRSK